MAEEFEESEVIFSDQEEYNKIGNYYQLTTQDQGLVKPKKQRKISSGDNNIIAKAADRRWDSTTGSLPVNINPSNVLRVTGYHQDYCEYEGGELVPPHVIVGRRIAGKMAFSVCTGNGRTLKGRDLSQVRNSILRLTGFLET